jgi:hypothetical protein
MMLEHMLQILTLLLPSINISNGADLPTCKRYLPLVAVMSPYGALAPIRVHTAAALIMTPQQFILLYGYMIYEAASVV